MAAYLGKYIYIGCRNILSIKNQSIFKGWAYLTLYLVDESVSFIAKVLVF